MHTPAVGRRSDAKVQFALLQQVQQARGNRALQRLIGNRARTAKPAAPVGVAAQPAIPDKTSAHGSVTVARLSLSDLNPIEAAKKLADRVFGVISSLGSAAWDTAKDLGCSAWTAAKEGGSAAWDGIKSAGSAAWDMASGMGRSAPGIRPRTWAAGREIPPNRWAVRRGTGQRTWAAAPGAGLKIWGGKLGIGPRPKARRYGAAPEVLWAAICEIARTAWLAQFGVQ